jgi:hypothetical protein
MLPFSHEDCCGSNLCSLYRGPCGQLMGNAPGAGERADVNKALYAVGLKEVDKRLHGLGGMADGEQKRGRIGTHYP